MENNNRIGRNDCLKGLSALVAGALGLVGSLALANQNDADKMLDTSLVFGAVGTALFLKYSIAGIYKAIKSEIRQYSTQI